MFGAIKKIFKRGGSGSQESSAQTQAAAEQEVVANEAAAESADYSADASGGDTLRVSLKALVPHLPKELQGKNPPRSDEALVLPKHQVLEQLAQGAVKVPFGQVRRVASVGVLAGGGSHDSRMVDVPLKEILAQLRGEGFPRRPDQRVISVPDEIQDIFGAKGEARAQMRVMQKDEIKPTGRSEQAAPPPEPAAPTPIPIYQTPTASSLGAGQRTPAAPASRPASPMQPIQRGEFLAFNVADISANWPDGVKREIQRLGAQGSKCLLPTVEIQEALKQGRVSYTWGQISKHLQPALAPHAQVSNEQTVLELPIATVASAFFTQAGNANANRPAVTAPANVEPLFRGGPAAPPQQQQRQAPPPPPRPAPSQPSPQLRMQQEAPLQPQQPIAAPALAQAAPRPTPAAPPPAAPAPARPAMGPSKGNVTFKVSDVTSGFPEELKKEVNNLRIASSKVAIPFEWVEPGLRTGKIEFSWAEFCGFVEGCPQQVQSVHAGSKVSLPLPVLAPLCLRLSPPTQRKAAVADDIPDIFSGGAAAPAAPPRPAAPARPAAPPPPPPKDEDEEEEEEEEAPIFQKAPARTAPTPAPRPATPPPQPTYTPQPPPTPAHAHGHAPAHADAGAHAKNLAELFGEPGKRNWTPNEIVQRTAQLPGVAGALIALQDGLLVANCMPQGWKTETIAAFLPQIFGRMTQYVKELSMGDLISVTVAVEQGTLLVYKAGIIYFAALARPDAALPFAALNLIARELSRHTK